MLLSRYTHHLCVGVWDTTSPTPSLCVWYVLGYLVLSVHQSAGDDSVEDTALPHTSGEEEEEEEEGEGEEKASDSGPVSTPAVDVKAVGSTEDNVPPLPQRVLKTPAQFETKGDCTHAHTNAHTNFRCPRCLCSEGADRKSRG